MNDEAQYMGSLYRARRDIKEIVEAPDSSIDRIIRSVTENNWVVSAELIKEFPVLNNEDIAGAIVEAVHGAFKNN